jgi:Tripartite tricarboxylate transporter TctB family
MVSLDQRQIVSGSIFVVIGALFLIGTRELDIGTAFRMGPGYFPLFLSILLMLLGLGIAVTGIGKTTEPHSQVSWRGIALILAAPVIFGLTVRGLGLAPAIAVAVFITAFASRRASVILAVAMSVALTVFCVAVFSYGLGLPLRVVGPWLGG